MFKFILLFTLLLFNINLLAAKHIENNMIKLQLNWKNQFQFAGYIMAKEKGFYSDYNLKVILNEVSKDINVVDAVLKGDAHFGIGRSSLIINRANGSKIVALASILQSSPHVLISLKRDDLKEIKDFKDKKIMISTNAKDDLVILSMLFSNSMSLDKMEVVPHTYNIEDLVTGKVDIYAAYTSNEPFVLKNKYKLDSTIFSPSEYGFDFYSDILFTSEELVRNHHKIVSNFKTASLNGWKYAFENIEETVDTIFEKYNTQNKSKKALLYEANKLKKLAYLEDKELGQIEEKRVEKINDFYTILGETNHNIDLNKFIFSNYKNNFLLTSKEKAYLRKKKILNLCIDPNWMPFEKFDELGNYVGLTSEYFKLFEKQLNTSITPIKTKSWSETLRFIKDKKCDILSAAMITKK